MYTIVLVRVLYRKYFIYKYERDQMQVKILTIDDLGEGCIILSVFKTALKVFKKI